MSGNPGKDQRDSSQNAFLVGTGILISRLIGMVREWTFARFFGNSDAADAFKAALKIPNLLQNLFGEGALSSSFIPVYSRLLAAHDKTEANRVARVIGSILALLMSVLVLIGIVATPFLIDIIAPGFRGTKREFTISMVRILFPGVGILVLSAWCLGILNSHRRFFLPYAAPVLWNIPMIAALLIYGRKTDLYPLAEYVAWGAVAGSLLQFLVQIPAVLRLAGHFRLEFETISSNIRTILRNFLPSVASRGVNQLSSYVDAILASFLPSGAVAALTYAQNIYLLPVSLFGTAISGAELPEMSSRLETGEDLGNVLRVRLNSALQRVAFFVVPSVAAFLLLGDSIVALLYQSGRFARADVEYVWLVLAGSTVGLLAATLGRLYTSTFWALRDTRTPLKFAVLRVLLTTGFGWLLAFPVPKLLGLPARIGLAGLTISAGFAAWLEFSLLRSAVNRRIGKTGLPLPYLIKLWAIALTAGGMAFAVKQGISSFPPILCGIIVISTFGILYLGMSAWTGLPQAKKALEAVRSRLHKR
jgi:putative peptidoglycan lipid II flippase